MLGRSAFRVSLVAVLCAVALVSQAMLAGQVALAGEAAMSAMSVSNLRVDNSSNPLGIDDTTPGLSWQLGSSERDQVQGAYEVHAASSGVTGQVI